MVTKAEAANPVLRIEDLGSATGIGDVTAFFDQVEIVRVSDGMVMSGAVANPSFETNGLSAGQYSYTTAGASWTFDTHARSGIARNGSAFGAPTPPQGDAVAFIQSQGGFNGQAVQTLALADGVYRVQFRTAQHTMCCSNPSTVYDQHLNVLVNGTSVGMIQLPSVTSYASFTSNTFVVGSPNNAPAFDAADDYVTGTNAQLPQSNAARTLEAWVNTTTSGNIIFNYDTATTNQRSGIDIFNGHLYYVGELNDLQGNITITDGRWHHVAASYNGTALNLYVDGVLDVVQNMGAFNTTGTTYHVGSRILTGAATGEQFNGRIDEVRIYNTALTAAQVQADQFSTASALSGNQKVYYNFDQGMAGGNNAGITTLTDQSGNGNTGTLTNSTPTGTTSNFVRSFPTITQIAPTSGPRGGSVLIADTNLTDATGFAFNGTGVAPFTTPTDDFSATVTVPAAATGPVSTASATLTTFTGPSFNVVTDLVVSDGTTAVPTPIPGGIYNSITVTDTGVAILAGNVTVNDFMLVNGLLSDGCSSISGAGSFTLAAGGILGICSPAGITSSGATGAVQVTGTRSFSTDASYGYNGQAQNTGSGLPATVANLAINTAGDVTLTQPVSVTQAVGVGGAGNLKLGGNALTLLSSATGAALVVNTGTGVVAGNTATVQRYLDPVTSTGVMYSGLGYRHYSSAPVSGSSVGDLTTVGFTPEVSQAVTYNGSATPGTITLSPPCSATTRAA